MKLVYLNVGPALVGNGSPLKKSSRLKPAPTEMGMKLVYLNVGPALAGNGSPLKKSSRLKPAPTKRHPERVL